MSEDAGEQRHHGDAQPPESEGYEKPKVDDIPVDRPAVTEPGILLVNGTPDGSG